MLFRHLVGPQVVNHILGMVIATFWFISCNWPLLASIFREWLTEFIFCININFIFWECQMFITHSDFRFCICVLLVLYHGMNYILGLLHASAFWMWVTCAFVWYPHCRNLWKIIYIYDCCHLTLSLTRRSLIRSALGVLTRSGVTTRPQK